MARGSFIVSREAARILIDQAMGGDLIYIVSKNALFAGPNNVAYGASKADQAHQVRLLAAELGEFGIRVNGVNPDGVVRGSGIFAKGWGADRARTYGIPEDKLGEFYAQRTLLKREVLPEHVAAAVFALAGGDLSQTDRAAHPGRRGRGGGLPPVTGRLVAAVDLGASSGRVMVGRVGPNDLELTEVHRFPNEPVRLPDGLHWDILRLYREVLAGLREAARAADDLVSVGVDSWGVDHALLDADGNLLANPYHYRDERTAAAVTAVHDVIAPAELYARTGIQFLPFNTVYALAADRGSAAFDAARTMLLIPDLIGLLAVGHPGHRGHQRVDHGPARCPSAPLGPRAHRDLAGPPDGPVHRARGAR